MLTGSWLHVLSGGMLSAGDVGYAVQLVSHRHLRYASGVLHVVLLAASAALAGSGFPYREALAAQLVLLALAGAGALRLGVPGERLAEYYVVVTAATLVALVAYLRRGVQLVWEQAEGTR
jgi:spore maturation protein SpmB